MGLLVRIAIGDEHLSFLQSAVNIPHSVNATTRQHYIDEHKRRIGPYLAPAHGLTLVNVNYTEDLRPRNKGKEYHEQAQG